MILRLLLLASSLNSDKVGFDYPRIRAISAGRLLYTHDAPMLSALAVG